ncbi:hypothetical protein RDWZM_001914 [Blomia tropicalis]|uniref:Major facilitator superfamily (MFS) profile domain-containing protein n=1 Tax=Blomia tropicalis TaxID=40697 RepID=A0A9Q0MDB7_BLOTA|nr:hypothetical protein RDWZM_001914 [Blomia tropicalis]
MGLYHCAGIRTWHIIILLCMLVNTISYTMRNNINMSIVAMVKDDQNETDGNTCMADEYVTEKVFRTVPILNRTFIERNVKFNSKDYNVEEQLPNEVFDWSESLQGTIVGAFYYSYMITMASGGQLADLFGSKRLLMIAVLISSLCTMATPTSAFISPYLVVAVRVLIGFVQGVITPTLYGLVPRWTPKSQLGIAIGFIQLSGNLGSIITMPICAFLAEYGFAGGWPSIFYVFGMVGIIFLLPWYYFVYDTPAVHPRISQSERDFIQNNLSISNGKRQLLVPWKQILTSRKVWAIAIARFSGGWSGLFLMSKLPAYLKTILHMPIEYNGYVNSSIYFSFGFSGLLWGWLSDYIERKRWLSRTISRKLFQSLALFGASFCLAMVPVAGCSIYGFTNAIASLPGFLAPLMVGMLLDRSDAEPMQQWNILFWVSSAISATGAIVFILGANSNLEKWGRASDMLDMAVQSKGDYGKVVDQVDVVMDMNNNDEHKSNE